MLFGREEIGKHLKLPYCSLLVYLQLSLPLEYFKIISVR